MTDVTTVETESGAADTNGAASTETVLTSANVDTGNENSDTGAAASADEPGSSGDGTGDAGSEGNDTPPDTYADFTLPEGMELDEAALNEASPLFKELGLNQEQAQKAVDLYAQLIQAGSQKQIDNFNQLMNDWRTQSQNDKEFGGDKFNENVKVAQSAINKFGTPELKQLLEDHGVGNHPEVIRFMVRVGRTLKEDVPGSTGDASSQAQSRVDILYPKQGQS